MTTYVVIGRFGKTHGTQGWLKVVSYTEPKENILVYQPWKIASKNNWKNIVLTAFRVHDNELLVHVEGVNSPEQAKLELTGKEIAIARDQLPETAWNEFYWADLEGLEVTTLQGISLGRVDYLFNSGANDVLVVKGERERLIPYIQDQVILEVSLAEKRIVVDWDPEF